MDHLLLALIGFSFICWLAPRLYSGPHTSHLVAGMFVALLGCWLTLVGTLGFIEDLYG